MTLRESVIMYRAKYNMTQKEFAAHAGIGTTTLVSLENGIKVSKVSEAKVKLALADKTGGVKNESV